MLKTCISGKVVRDKDQNFSPGRGHGATSRSVAGSGEVQSRSLLTGLSTSDLGRPEQPTLIECRSDRIMEGLVGRIGRIPDVLNK